MPKHKVGDVFRDMAYHSDEFDWTIRCIIEHEGKAWYLVEQSAEGVRVMEESFLDQYYVRIPKYTVGDIWRNADGTQVLMVIENPHDNAPYMERITGGSGLTSRADASWYESKYGDLTKWEPYRG